MNIRFFPAFSFPIFMGSGEFSKHFFQPVVSCLPIFVDSDALCVFFLSSACFLVAYTLLTFICRCRTCWFDSRLQQQPQATHKQKIPISQELAIPVPSPACGIESMETPLSGYRGWSFSSRVRNFFLSNLVSAGCCSVRYCCFKEVSFALFFC